MFSYFKAEHSYSAKLLTLCANCKKCIPNPMQTTRVDEKQNPRTNQRKVKSQNLHKSGATDDHERRKDFLGPDEIDKLLEAAKGGRHGRRDHLLCLLSFRHGLRISEALRLRISDFDLGRARLWVNRLKGGLSTEHPLAGDELRAIKNYLRDRTGKLPWLFLSERNSPMTRQSGNYILKMAATRAGLKHVHPHMMRHSCGFYLANAGYDLRLIQDYLGHRDPKHTTRYTRVAAARFEGLWGK